MSLEKITSDTIVWREQTINIKTDDLGGPLA